MLRHTTKLLRLRSTSSQLAFSTNTKACILAEPLCSGVRLGTLRERSIATLGRPLTTPLTWTPVVCSLQNVRLISDDSKKDKKGDDKVKYKNEKPAQQKTGEEVFYQIPTTSQRMNAAAKTFLGLATITTGFTLINSLGHLSAMSTPELFLTIAPFTLSTYLFCQLSTRITDRCEWIKFKHDTQQFTLGQTSKWFPFITTQTSFKENDLIAPADPVMRLKEKLKAENGQVKEQTLMEKITSLYRLPDPDPLHYLFKDEKNERKFYLEKGHFSGSSELKDLFIKKYQEDRSADRYVLGKLWEYGEK